MGVLTYKEVGTKDDLFYHVKRLRYLSYYKGKNKTMDESDGNTEFFKGKKVMKMDPYDEYSKIYLFFFDNYPVGTVRFTMHSQHSPAPLSSCYPDIVSEVENTDGTFQEVSRYAVDEKFRGKGFFFLFTLYLGGLLCLEKQCLYSYMECPFRLAQVYNQYLGAEIVYNEPRYYPSNNLPIYLARINVGTFKTLHRYRQEMFFKLLGQVIKLQDIELMNKWIVPISFMLRKVFFLNEKKHNFTELMH